MFILKFFNKHHRTKTDICLCQDGEQIHKTCQGLNDYIGYVSGMGLWSYENEKVDGYFFVNKEEVIPAEELDKNFLNFVEKIKKTNFD